MLSIKVCLIAIVVSILSLFAAPATAPMEKEASDTEVTFGICMLEEDFIPVCEHTIGAAHSTMVDIHRTTYHHDLNGVAYTLKWYRCSVCGYEEGVRQ